MSFNRFAESPRRASGHLQAHVAHRFELITTGWVIASGKFGLDGLHLSQAYAGRGIGDRASGEPEGTLARSGGGSEGCILQTLMRLVTKRLEPFA